MQDRDRLRYLEKRDKKVELLQAKIELDSRWIKEAQVQLDTKMQAINKKQKEVDVTRVSLNKQIKIMKDNIKALQQNK